MISHSFHKPDQPAWLEPPRTIHYEKYFPRYAVIFIRDFTLYIPVKWNHLLSSEHAWQKVNREDHQHPGCGKPCDKEWCIEVWRVGALGKLRWSYPGKGNANYYDNGWQRLSASSGLNRAIRVCAFLELLVLNEKIKYFLLYSLRRAKWPITPELIPVVVVNSPVLIHTHACSETLWE